MTELPKDIKHPTGFTEYGLDATGDNLFFGFKVKSGKDIQFAVSHTGLGEVIHYLQHVAQKTQERRLSIDPTIADKEVLERQSNLVVKIDMIPDVIGSLAMLDCTNQSGTHVEAQIPFDLVESLHNHLPSLINEMKERQSAYEQQH